MYQPIRIVIFYSYVCKSIIVVQIISNLSILIIVSKNFNLSLTLNSHKIFRFMDTTFADLKMSIPISKYHAWQDLNFFVHTCCSKKTMKGSGCSCFYYECKFLFANSKEEEIPCGFPSDHVAEKHLREKNISGVSVFLQLN